MLFATVGQAYVFLATVYGGLAMGLTADVFDTVADLFSFGPKLRAALDWVFWLIVDAVAFYVLLRANDGELRLYTVLGFFVGWLLYTLSLHRPVRALLEGACGFLRGAARWLRARPLVQKLFR